MNLHVFEFRSLSLLSDLRQLASQLGVSDLGPHLRAHCGILAQIVEDRTERDCQDIVSSDTASSYELLVQRKKGEEPSYVQANVSSGYHVTPCEASGPLLV